MNQLVQRIKTAYHLETDAEVADFLGINPSTLSMQKNRGKFDLARIIRKCSDLNMNWLLHGQGPIKYNGHESLSDYRIKVDAQVLDQNENSDINSDDLRIIFTGDKSHLSGDSVSLHSMESYTVPSDSMEPTLKENDVVIVNVDDKHPIDGSVFLISYNRTVLFRRLQEQPDNHYLVSSDNDSYESFEVATDNTNLEIIGKVSLLIRSL
ncbi:MAG TPA: LexA family transcriptional regulator [Balneolaceae bacterium]|nr:LexA family transcriptional regulator [Balneolaceae bacterium]